MYNFFSYEKKQKENEEERGRAKHAEKLQIARESIYYIFNI